jgi:hypothetical protein
MPRQCIDASLTSLATRVNVATDASAAWRERVRFRRCHHLSKPIEATGVRVSPWSFHIRLVAETLECVHGLPSMVQISTPRCFADTIDWRLYGGRLIHQYNRAHRSTSCQDGTAGSGSETNKFSSAWSALRQAPLVFHPVSTTKQQSDIHV